MEQEAVKVAANVMIVWLKIKGFWFIDLTLRVTTGPNSARTISAKNVPADFGITL